MKRRIHFKGAMADLFGDSMSVEATNFKEAIRCVEVNRPGFKAYLSKCVEDGTNFSLTVGSQELDEHTYLSEIEGDFYLTPIPSGSSSGKSKIGAALLLAALIFINPGHIFLGGTEMLAVPITKWGYAAASLATNLAMTGIQQILAPDPSVDADEPTSYLFNGAEQNVLEGDPVPILYGELRVPGTPVSFEIINRKFQRNNVMTDADGHLILAGA